MSRFDYDVAIVGGGSAGYAAARTAAAMGRRTVVIEGGAEVGGLCILRGCMPSKALLQAAEVRHLIRRAGVWGLRVKSAGFDFARVMSFKAGHIAEFADYRRHQLENGRFKFIRARASFADPHTLRLTPLTTARHRPRARRLTARHIVLATGSVVAPPPLAAMEAAGYLTSDDVLSLPRLPRSLLVLGGGAIACELAQFLARFGVRVTMIQRSAHILKEFDPDTATVIETVLRREGVRLFTGTRLRDARRERGQKTVVFEHDGKIRRVTAEEILFALGRVPNIAGLALGAAGVRTENGRIWTNARMQTSAPHIFAVGDCTGPHEIVHLAIQQGEIAAHNLAAPRALRRMDYRLLMNVVFTDPQVATVGLTEQAAAARGLAFRVASYPFHDHGKSLIMEARDGLVKLLAEPRTGKILGGACVGPMGGELIHEITVALARRMTVHELAAVPHYHPTLAEIWTYPAEELAAQIPRRGRSKTR